MKRTLFLVFLLIIFPTVVTAQSTTAETETNASTVEPTKKAPKTVEPLKVQKEAATTKAAATPPKKSKKGKKKATAKVEAKTSKKKATAVVSQTSPENEDAENSGEEIAVTQEQEALAISQPTLTALPADTQSEQPLADDEKEESDSAGSVTVEWGTVAQVPENGTALYLVDPTAPRESVNHPPVPRSAGHRRSHPATWKTNTEWFSAAFGMNTYGMGGNLTVATLRWSTVYWDTVKVHAGAWKKTQHSFASSILGMPFWAAARHEFRVGTGIGAGYLKSRKKIDANDSGFEDSGISAEILKTYILLPFEAKYIFHYKKHLAFYASTTLAFPLYFSTTFESTQRIDPEEYEISYRPFFGISAGIRL